MVTLGFGFKSYVGYRMRQRRQKEIQKENETYYSLLREALPPGSAREDAFNPHPSPKPGVEERISKGCAAAAAAGGGGVLAVTGGVETVPDKNNRSPDKQIPRPDSSPDLSKVRISLLFWPMLILPVMMVASFRLTKTKLKHIFFLFSQTVRPLPSLAVVLLVFPMVLLVTRSILSAGLLLPPQLLMVKLLMNLMSQVLVPLMLSLSTGLTPSLSGLGETRAGREEKAVTRRVRRRQQRKRRGTCLS